MFPTQNLQKSKFYKLSPVFQKEKETMEKWTLAKKRHKQHYDKKGVKNFS